MLMAESVASPGYPCGGFAGESLAGGNDTEGGVTSGAALTTLRD